MSKIKILSVQEIIDRIVDYRNHFDPHSNRMKEINLLASLGTNFQEQYTVSYIEELRYNIIAKITKQLWRK